MTFITRTKDEAPSHSADGPFIMTGFRPALSCTECIQSMFRWHNQSINIWTSVALIVGNLYCCHWLTSSDTDFPIGFYTTFWIHGTLRAFCWLNSWAYHTFMCVSQDMANFLCRLDYIGCYLTPLGMGTNLVFLLLHSRPMLCGLVLGAGSVFVFAAICLAVMPHYQQESYRPLRMILSFLVTVPYFVGIGIGVLLRSADESSTVFPEYLQYLCVALGFELVGGFFYVTMIPERFVQNTFDCWFSSHSLWHWCNFGFDFFMFLSAFSVYRQQHNSTCTFPYNE